MTSVTSSFTPLMTSNSCSASSNRTCVTAAPGIDDSSVRRRLLPSVCPKPGSSGEIVKRLEVAFGFAGFDLGSLNDEHEAALGKSRSGSGLLGVELDDELLAHRDVDLLAEREIAHRRGHVGRR